MTVSAAKFEVGQVVHHLKFGYRGVVFDVDPCFQGTEEWYEQVARSRPPKDRPWYHVLVHDAAHTTYVAERNLQPDLSGHLLLLEEIDEPMYCIDRALFHITSNPNIRDVAGIRLGRCSRIPPNDLDFGMTEEEVVAEWCARAGIPYLGRADIGHDSDNKVVPFGRLRRG